MFVVVLIIYMLLSVLYSNCLQHVTIRNKSYHTSNLVMMSKTLKVRPTIDDIERISYGQAAKRRGTGSRAVPHRLNAMERKEWDLAKRRRYLLLRGTGWRKERGDSPLANIYRNYCDAVAVPCVSVRRGVQDGSLLYDEVVIDLSPLRLLDISVLVNKCIDESKNFDGLIEYENLSDITKLGWLNMNASDVLKNEVIWRIPFFGLTFKYKDRKECKKFAEKIAQIYANGEVIKDIKEDYDD